MTLTLPDEPALAAFREDQLRLELACALYSTRGISRGLAAKLAGMEAEAFEAELHARSISNGLKPSDLDADLAVFDKLLKP
jgi:predicted HTH domain antitoxin